MTKPVYTIRGKSSWNRTTATPKEAPKKVVVIAFPTNNYDHMVINGNFKYIICVFDVIIREKK